MKITDTLKILASTKDNQIGYLIKIGTFPSTDELALQFLDTYNVFKAGFGKGVKNIPVNKNSLKNLDRIKIIFDDMSNIPNNPFWEASSLNIIEWNKVRKLARDTLQLMDGGVQ
ncbi:hypothetical protein L0P88_08860 [Muricauda sp. SCSIO 64092]|uniref:hypothetical protein n=1 Tax=Allomuricauda sp. SCSIO 64092 TaxID=2908842 RepID=UPI001FF1B246|nr:hypothetical protein [Muricauda sp. SCSIO 64092]UOY08649.1 hypothetical protein L0P88_08860 [Muricauda sp. SCSIO 64092]